MPSRRAGPVYKPAGGRNMTRKQKLPEQEETVAAARKREERAKREAYKKERKIESYLADDENFPSFAVQLEKVGLQLRDIPGDGNCLFRALGDQLEGHCRNHYRHRQDVVRYMVDHRSDFEPFIEDDIPFDVHVQNLKKLGVYAGNDAIVAFARLHQVNIVIHQLNAKHLMITGCPNHSAKQLHISYHNGDHYSSIRKLHDNTESPANIRIQDKSDESERSILPTSAYKSKGGGGGGGYVRAMRGCQVIEEEVIAATKCHDLKLIRETLTDCDYDADAAIAHLMQLLELTDTDEATCPGTDDSVSVSSHVTSTTDSGVWSDRVYGTTTLCDASSGKKSQRVHFREDSYGGSSGYGSMSSNHGGARPKLVNLTMQHQQHPVQLSARKQKEIKKMEKKMRAEERHRQRVMHSQPPTPPVAAESTAFTVMSPRTSSITMI